MTTLPIVEHFHPLEDILLGVFACRIALIMDKFFLERGEEALDDGIIPAVALAAHGAVNAMCTEQSLVIEGGVLHTAIRMMREPRSWFASPQRHGECISSKLGGEARSHGPADHRARIELEHDGEIEPALEPPRGSRRLIDLSHAAMADPLTCA